MSAFAHAAGGNAAGTGTDAPVAPEGRKRGLSTWLLLLPGVLWLLVFFVFPLAQLFSVSLQSQFPNYPGYYYRDVNFGNYVDALTAGGTSTTLATAFVNSLAITIPATIIPITFASLAAYAFAWIDFKGRNMLFVFVFALQIVPLQMALVPLLSLFSEGLTVNDVQIFPGFGLNNVEYSFARVWIAHAIFALPLATFMLHNFISEIPGDVVEAARVDGAGHGQVFFRIILPLAMPAIASFGIFQFLWVWNDLLVATIFASPGALPITQALNSLSGTWGNRWFLQSAGTFISIIVPLIVFFSLQRFFVRGLLAGATKG